MMIVLPCLLAAPAKAKPAAAPPPPAAPEPVAAAAPPPPAAPIPTTMPPVPPVSAQPIDSKPGEATAAFSSCQASSPWGEFVRLKAISRLALNLKASLCYCPGCSRLQNSAMPGIRLAHFAAAYAPCCLTRGSNRLSASGLSLQVLPSLFD